jgi:hypothetical protein
MPRKFFPTAATPFAGDLSPRRLLRHFPGGADDIGDIAVNGPGDMDFPPGFLQGGDNKKGNGLRLRSIKIPCRIFFKLLLLFPTERFSPPFHFFVDLKGSGVLSN